MTNDAHSTSPSPTRLYAPPYDSQSKDGFLERLSRMTYAQRRLFLRKNIAPRFPTHFYRYLSVNPDDATAMNRLRDLLVRSDLWLSSINSFNDPFELSVRLDMRGTGAEIRARLTRQFRQMERKPREADIQRRVSELMSNPGALEEITWKGFRKNLDRLGISCLTTDPRNIQMWSYYARDHTGIALQFEVARFDDWQCIPVPVRYPDDNKFPVIKWRFETQDQLREVMLRKQKHWSHEKEWRIIHPDGAGCYLPFNPKALRAVIFGCKATAPVVEAVRRLTDERDERGRPPLRLYKAEKHESQFKLRIRSMPTD